MKSNPYYILYCSVIICNIRIVGTGQDLSVTSYFIISHFQPAIIIGNAKINGHLYFDGTCRQVATCPYGCAQLFFISTNHHSTAVGCRIYNRKLRIPFFYRQYIFRLFIVFQPPSIYQFAFPISPHKHTINNLLFLFISEINAILHKNQISTIVEI